MRQIHGMGLLLPALACIGIACDSSPQAKPTSGTAAAPTARDRSESGGEDTSRNRAIGLITSGRDSRLAPLLEAAERWKLAPRLRRRVVDRVYLVPDLPSFFAAIAAWDEGSYFPILFDDPAWSLPFLRSFRPSQVVRFHWQDGSNPAHRGSGNRANPLQGRWTEALRAVSLAWTAGDASDTLAIAGSRALNSWGDTSPGLVLSHADSPMLAAAVALAAGRFQPLIDLDPVLFESSPAESGVSRLHKRYADVLSLEEARSFARRIERKAERAAGPCLGLGDACDFLTLAGDYPYRYRREVGSARERGDSALDDLIGRRLETEEEGGAADRRRWAFTGRMLGSPAASLYRAMCSLFLQPESPLLWNTYGADPSRWGYAMDTAGTVLSQMVGGSPPIHQTGSNAGISAWHRMLDPSSRFGFVMFNSSGFPRDFSIDGGPGYPSDLPRGVPAVVSFIHSYSAADPNDSSTLAGRWLENGAFLYYGSMNEPFLQAFRPPSTVVELAEAGLPLSAALRQGEFEPFGQPWRLVYLGDPLFTLVPPTAREKRLEPGPAAPLLVDGKPLASTLISAASAPPDPASDEPARLDSCLTAVIQSLCRRAPTLTTTQPDLRSALLAIDRGKLAPTLRGSLDELTIDTLLNAGERQRLLKRLLEIPHAEASPRVIIALETLIMGRLMSLRDSESLENALGLWDVAIRRPWPAGSTFPTDLTGRLSHRVQPAPSQERNRYIEHLKSALQALDNQPELFRHKALVTSELKRLGQPASEPR